MRKKSLLLIKNLHVSTSDRQILNGIDLAIQAGEIHAVMGPNGAGKTTLALSLMGAPSYKMLNHESAVKFEINGKDVVKLTPEERARAGLFISFQHPVEITGISILAFLRTAYKSLYKDEKISLSEFKLKVKDALKAVDLPESFMQRSLNEGFSGGEKKRAEIVQLLVLKAKFAILDEIDSGLDVDSLKIVAKAVEHLIKKARVGVLLITHYQRILHYLKPDYVHVLIDGKIKKSGGIGLVRKIEKGGYAAI